MIAGVGIDLLEVARMRREIARDGLGFAEEVFLPAEIERCEGAGDPAGCYAVLFAAKEAVVKALALRSPDFSVWREMEVRPREGGGHEVLLSGRTRSTAEARRVKALHLSCCRTETVAAALAVVEI